MFVCVYFLYCDILKKIYHTRISTITRTLKRFLNWRWLMHAILKFWISFEVKLIYKSRNDFKKCEHIWKYNFDYHVYFIYVHITIMCILNDVQPSRVS